MPDIRPLHRDDLPQVGALIAREYGPVLPAGGEAAWLSDLLCDQPWADPEVPSLVAAAEDGAIIGFMGAHARRVRLGERELRAAVCSHLVVDAERRSTAAGAMLVSRFMSGAQDLSYSDTAIEVVARMWRAAGGSIDPVRSLAWARVLRPAPWLARVAAGRFGSGDADAGLTPFRPLPIDRGVLRGSVEGLDEEPLTPAVMMEHAEALLAPLSLRLGYTEGWLDWLFGRLEHDQRPSRVVSRLVRRRGRPIGWYVYVRRPSGAGEVLQIAGRPRDIDAVLAVAARVRQGRRRGGHDRPRRAPPGRRPARPEVRRRLRLAERRAHERPGRPRGARRTRLAAQPSRRRVVVERDAPLTRAAGEGLSYARLAAYAWRRSATSPGRLRVM